MSIGGELTEGTLFGAQIDSFHSSMRSLRDFVDFADPICLAREMLAVKSSNRLVALVPDLMERHESAGPGAFVDCFAEVLPLDPEAQGPDPGTVSFEFVTDKGGQLWVRNPSNNASFTYQDYAEQATTLFRTLLDVHGQLGLLRKAALISLVSSVESFMGEVIRAWYCEVPDDAWLDERQLSLSELRQLGSIEAVRDYLIQLQVDVMLRKSLDEWLNDLKSRFKVSLDGYLAEGRPRLVELFQRRNLWVHNDGKVGQRYLNTVEPSLRREWTWATPSPLARCTSTMLSTCVSSTSS